MDTFLNDKEMQEYDIWLNESMNMDILDLQMIDDLYMLEDGDKQEKENPKLLEKVKKLAKKLTAMLAKIIQSAKDAISNIGKKIKKKLKTAKMKLHIKHIKMMKTDKPVEFIDVWKLEDHIKAEARELGLLCSGWARSYAKRGKGVMAANKFEDAFNHIVRVHEDKIDQIKKNKIKVSSQKAKKWLLKNTQYNGELCGMINVYVKDIEKAKDMLADIQIKKETFIQETGYDNGPVTFTRVVHNATGYVKRNADWLSMYFLSAVTLIGSHAYKTHVMNDIAHDADKVMPDEGVEDKNGNIVPDYNSKKFKQKVNQYYHDPDNETKTKKRINSARAVSGGLAAMGTLTANSARKQHRNSI